MKIDYPNIKNPDGLLFVRLYEFQREEAQKLRDQVEEATGSKGFLVSTPSGFRVQMGVFRLKENAETYGSSLNAGSSYRAVFTGT